MNIGINSLNAADITQLTKAMQRSTDIQELSLASAPPMKDGKINLEQAASNEYKKFDKRMKLPKASLEKDQKRKEDLDGLVMLQDSLASQIGNLNRSHGMRQVSSDTGILGYGLKGSAIGNYDVNVLQKAVKCRFVFEATNTNGVSNPWTSDTTQIVDNADSDGVFNISGVIENHFSVTRNGTTKNVTLNPGHNITETVERINDSFESGGISINVTAKIEVYDGNKRRIVLESDDVGTGGVFTVSNNNNPNIFANVGPKYAGEVVKSVELKQADGTSWDSSIAMNTNTTIPSPNSVLIINNMAVPIGNHATTDNTLTYLGNIVEDINRYSEDTGIFAVIVNDGGDDRYLQLRRSDGGAGIDINTSPSDTPFLRQSCVEYTEISSQGMIEYNGAKISSSSNLFQNILPGITLNISDAKLGESRLKVSSSQDWSGSVNSLFSKYNDLVDFLNDIKNDKDAQGIRQRKMSFGYEFLSVEREVNNIASHKMFLGNAAFDWKYFGVHIEQGTGKATIDTAKLDKVLEDPINMQALENFMAGTARISGRIPDNTTGGNSIIRQANTYAGGGSLKLGATHNYAMTDFSSVEINFSGGDRGDVNNYTATIHVDSGTASIKDLVMANGILEIRGNDAWGNLALDYTLPAGNEGYTDRIFATYLTAGATASSTSNLSLLSSGGNLENMNKITNVAIRSNEGAYEAHIMYDGKVARVAAAGGGPYTFTIDGTNPDLPNFSIQFNIEGDPLAHGQSQLFNVAFATGIGSNAGSFESNRDSLKRSVRSAQNELELATEKYIKIETRNKDRLEKNIMKLQSDAILKDNSHLEQLLQSLLEV